MTTTDDAPHDRITPPPFLLKGASALVFSSLPGSRAVGGCVRDHLAGRKIHDVDVAAPMAPEEIVGRLRAAGMKVIATGIAHGTVTAVLDGQPIEVTSLRVDMPILDAPRFLTEVAWTTDWREDAIRRDFTINAMSLSQTGDLWDYHGGRHDLRQGVVRFLGQAVDRLREDPLRIMRYFRFRTKFGRGAHDREALEAIRLYAPRLGGIAVERIWSELKKLLEASSPVQALRDMRAEGILDLVIAEGHDVDRVVRLEAMNPAASATLRMATLIPTGAPDWVERAAVRMRFSNEERRQLGARTAAAAWPTQNLDGLDFRRWLAGMASGAHTRDLSLPEDLAWLAEVDDGLDRSALRARISETERPVLPLRGQDALDAGVSPGPRVTEILGEVGRWWLEGGCLATRDECLLRLREVLEFPPAALAPR